MTTPYLGSIMLFAGNFNPVGYLRCDGSLQSIANNSALYALIGTTYGGDGINTFALPDLRGRTPLHQGQGPGLSNQVIGQLSGVESVALTAAQLPAHTHQVIATTVDGTTSSPANALPAAPALPSAFLYLNPAATGTTDALPNAASITSAGSSVPHTNIMPSLALTYVIASEGIFPSRN